MSSWAGLATVLPLAWMLGCAASSDVRSFPILQRSAVYDPTEIPTDYAPERDYIAKRRAARDVAAGDDRYLGLALSGGGIRAATVSLGVVQALTERGLMDRVDYMSAVSGGGYTASWIQAHLGAEQAFLRDNAYYEVGAEDFAGLTDPDSDHVGHLRTHAGFLNRGGWWEGLDLLGRYLVTLPCSHLLDVGLHLKTRLNNHCHPIQIYKNRIEHLYFRGDPPSGEQWPPKRELRLFEVNHHSYVTPYLVLNGNLAAWGRPRSREARDLWEPYNFEFTRDLTGSDGLGYVDTQAFGRPALDVAHAGGRPVEVSVDLASGRDGDFPLSAGSAAAGAAFDPDGFITGIRWKALRGVVAYALAPLNMNLGYEAPNFARRLSGWRSALDYLAMVTYQRLPIFVTTGARWIKVTDGGHYDNLGIAALARRGVACIVAVDATGDPHRSYGDLESLRERLRTLGLQLNEPSPAVDTARRAFHRFTISVAGAPDAVVSEVLYLKSSADDGLPHMEPGDDEVVGKIRAYRDSPDGYGKNVLSIYSPYPHTTTLQQWYDWERFEAYRLLGYQIARTHLDADVLEGCRGSAQVAP